MKFLCDVHISIRLSKSIEEMGFQSQHVNTILDKWLTKDEVIAS
jgi:predicted nuclease of predicted toxin-antitoxin system